MAKGWAGEDAAQEQIDATVNDAIAAARSRLSTGPSRSHCESCGEAIPEQRRSALPGVRLCLPCQAEADNEHRVSSGYNRRGSKDSQLR